MRLPFYKQFIVIVLLFSIAFNADLSRFVLAADEAIDSSGTAAENPDDSEAIAAAFEDQGVEYDESAPESEAIQSSDTITEVVAEPASLASFGILNDATAVITAESNTLFNLTSALGLDSGGVSRITMPASDLEKIKTIWYMAKVFPDYANDNTSLYRDLPAPSRDEVDKALAAEALKTTPFFNSPETYLDFLKDGGDVVSAPLMIANTAIYNGLLESAEGRLDSTKIKAIWTQLSANIRAGKEITTDSDIIQRVSGVPITDVITRLGSTNLQDRAYLADKIDYTIEHNVLDLRVVKTLVYLVTPKSLGGAGHWKITVSRIFQRTTASNESQPQLATIESNTTNTAAECADGATAADCGYQQASRATAEVEDQNGKKYEAYIQDMTVQEDQTLTSTSTVAEAKVPTNVHVDGQAFDISQIDDIRCTLIEKKRVGSDKITAKPIQPIKLAWQTSEGYAASGGSASADVMGMMKTVASDSLKGFLSTFNGDMSSYDGDLSRASFEDVLKILGESMVGYAVSGSGQIALKGYDVTSTLKNLGGMYLADYMGLPREIFMGENALNPINALSPATAWKDIEEVKYLIGRTAIEQRLGLPYGSFDNSIIVNGTEEHNLEGLLTNLGRRKLETEMNLEQGALKSLSSGVTVEFAVGKSIIEQEFNLKSGTWPISDMTFEQTKSTLPILRAATMSSDAPYVDSLFRLPAGSTQQFVYNRGTAGFSSYEYTTLVGKTRMDDTAAGLKYFASYNDAYQLPQGTWEKAIAGNTEGYKTIGIYTMARLLGDDFLTAETTNLPTDTKAESITWTEEGLPYTYGTDQNLGATDLGRLAFRTWLRENLNPAKTKDNGCKALRTGFNVDVAVNNGGGRTIEQSMDLVRSQICPLQVKIDYKVNYKVGLSLSSVDESMIIDIPETKAKAVGLDNLDLFRMMGSSDANGKTVMTRIGSKILYYALINKTLSSDDRMKIDLKDVNPVIQTDSKDINFYIDHIFTAIDLADKIEADWSVIKKDDTKSREIADKIDEIVARVGTTFSDSESDASRFQKIAGIARDVTSLIQDLTKNVKELQAYYATSKDKDAPQKVAQINGMIIHINALKNCLAEMIAGKVIKQVDDMTLNEIELNIPTSTNLTDSSSDRRAKNKMSAWKMANLLFSFLSGKITLTDAFITIGCGVAESNLGLPSNSFFYLVQNYERRALQAVDGFYEAIGQARIEEQFNMPAFYFQGFSLDSPMPKFGLNSKLLKQWLPDNAGGRDYTPLKKLSDDAFDQFISNLLFPGIVINQFGSVAPKKTVGSPMLSANYSVMIWDAESNWQKVRTEELANNGRSVVGEKTLDDVTRNITERGYGDGLRNAEDDLLFKMALPTGNYSSLTDGGSSAWSTNTATATKIDDVFGIAKGSTQSLFTGENSLYSTSVTKKEKNQIQASSLNIGQNFLEKYIQLLNGEILPSEMDLYAYGQTSDYINNNPYARLPEAVDICPIVYSSENGFQVNSSETYLANDSFCYYDQKGRHCFQSSDEAARYANTNEVDSLKHMRLEDTNGDGKIDQNDDEIGNDILGYMAMKLTIAYNNALLVPGVGVDAFGRIATDTSGNSLGASLKLSWDNIYSGLTDFLNDKNKKTIFDDITVNNVKMSSATAFALIGQQTGLSTELLTRLFSRTTIDAPVANYKKMVGREEAQKIITAQMFNLAGKSDLGFGPFDAKMFDSGDLYDILHGDFSSVYQVGAKIVDDQMEYKSGTTMLIAAAGSAKAITCAMAQAGGQYLGSLFGISYVPLNGINGTRDLLVSIGQAKIEETLSLPRGSFNGASIQKVIEQVGAINFAVAFKIPQKNSVSNELMASIVGANKAASLANSSDLNKLKAIQSTLKNSAVLSKVAYAAMRTLEANILDNVTYIINILSSADPGNLQVAIGPNSSKDQIIWHNEVANFVSLLWSIDANLSLVRGTTFKLFSNGLDGAVRMTPTEYARRVSDKAVDRALAVGLGTALGLSSTQAGAAADLIINLQIVFACESPNDSSTGQSHEYNRVAGTCTVRSQSDQLIGTTVNRTPETLYHNWGYVYDNLDKIFNFRLDERANVPQGTMAQLIREPENALRIGMRIGTAKLDAKYGINPTQIASFSGFFKYMFPADLGTPATPITDNSADILLNQGMINVVNAINQKNAELATFQAPYNSKFGELIPLVEKLNASPEQQTQVLLGLESTLMSSDTDSNKLLSLTAPFAANTSVMQQASGILEELIPLGVQVSRCLSELTTLELQYKDLSGQVSTRNAQLAQTITTERIARANALDLGNSAVPFGVKLANRTWEWIKDAAAETVHGYLINVEWNGENVGVDMPMSDIKLIFTDIRYIGIAAMAISVNLVQVKVDRVGIKNCNSTQIANGKCPMAVPAEFRINYQDLFLSFYGLPALDANRLAAFVYVTGNTANPAATPYNPFNAACPNSGTGAFSTGVDCMGAVIPNNTNSIESMQNTMHKVYDFNAETYAAAIATNQAVVTAISNEAEGYCLAPNGSGPNGQGKNDPDYLPCIDRYRATHPDFVEAEKNVNILNTPQEPSADVKSTKEVIQAANRAMGRERLQYKLMDIGLWKLDDNVFPGFSSALMKGSGDAKIAALTKYFENGLAHGHLFGIRFNALSESAQLVVKFALGFVDHKFISKDNDALQKTFVEFASGAGLNFLTNWVVDNSKDWFGFEMPPDVFKGILVGLCTGKWGLNDISFDQVTGTETSQTTDIGSGIKLPTLGAALVAFASNWVFKWADKQFKWKAGTAYTVFTNGYALYKAIKLIGQLSKITNSATLIAASKTAQDAVMTATGAKKITDLGDDAAAAGAAKAATSGYVSIAKIIAYFAAESVKRTITAKFSQDFRDFENENGLVPGSLNILSDGIIDFTVGAAAMVVVEAGAYIAAGGGSAGAAAASSIYQAMMPGLLWALAAVAVLFIIANLFGVYQTDYYCSADGYYPYINSTTSNSGVFGLNHGYTQTALPSYVTNDNDVTGLGIWGGKVSGREKEIQALMEAKSIEVAQYKARTLIGDLLNLQNFTKYNDSSNEPTVPIQIMTGRQVDVDYWEGSISTNMCQARLGEGYMSKNGICSKVNSQGDIVSTTRMGVWMNLQNVAFTHIGF
jgi:hypothetical protein